MADRGSGASTVDHLAPNRAKPHDEPIPISPIRAAEIAKAKGLTLPDARALSVMAEDDDDAEALAAIFESPASDDEFANQIARAIAARAARQGADR